MATTLDVVEGWTGPLDFTLKSDGVAQDLTGMSVALNLWDKDGNAITIGGSTSVTTPAAGVVRFNPATGDLLQSRSPVRARWQVTDGAGKIVYFPNAAPDLWSIYKP